MATRAGLRCPKEEPGERSDTAAELAPFPQRRFEFPHALYQLHQLVKRLPRFDRVTVGAVQESLADRLRQFLGPVSHRFGSSAASTLAHHASRSSAAPRLIQALRQA